MIHEKILALDDSGRREWADAIGLADNSADGWNAKGFDGRDGGKVNAHEYIAEKWEDYLAAPDNPAIPSKLKALFDRIAAAMRRVYEALGRTVREVEPELKAMFDRLVTDGAETANSGKTGVLNADNGRIDKNTALNSEKKGLPSIKPASQNQKGESTASMADDSGLVNTYADVGKSGIFDESNGSVENTDTNADSLKNTSKAYENVGKTDAPKAVSDFNGWASRPSSSLPESLYFIAGDMDIRTKPEGGLAESPTETLWISNREGARKYLFPNPRLFDQMTDIGRLYRMDQSVLKDKGKNTATVTRPAEMTAEGFVEFPGEMELNGPKNVRDTLFSLEKDESRKIIDALKREAVPLETVEFSREKYDSLFPKGIVLTPLGVVKMGHDQFTKLMRKGREKLLWAMRQTLENPVAILPETRDGKESRLYLKSFSKKGDKKTTVMTVVVTEGENNIAISTSERKPNLIKRKIKWAGSPLYLHTREVTALQTGSGEAESDAVVQTGTLSDNSAEKSTPLSGAAGGTLPYRENAPLFSLEVEQSPLDALRQRADAIADGAEKARVIAELDGLERLYPPETNKYLAPNGNASKLAREQWYAVRTSSFKKWFGDWEALAKKEMLEGKEVFSVRAKDIPIRDGKIISTALDWIGNNPQTPVETAIGKVIISNDGIRADFSHTRYPNKLYSLPAVRAVLENGAYLGNLRDITGKDITNHYFAAPITIDEGRKIAFVRVREMKNGNSFYVHEVFVSDEIEKSAPLNSTLKFENRRQTVDLNNQGRAKWADLYKSIIQDVTDVNPSKISAVRDDETGEPLPVYHGTHAEFDVFDRNAGTLNDAGWSGEGHYFYEDWEEATQYSQGDGGRVVPVFINVREPYYLSDEERNELVDRDERDYSAEFTGQLRGDGYDGVYYNGDLRREWTVFDSTQIKSAEGNAGTFAEANPSILFQLTREGELEAAREAVANGTGREEFIADQTAYSEAMDEAMPDGVTSAEEAGAWLGSIYDEAAGTGEGKLTTTEIDEKLADELRADRGRFRNFMELAGATLKHEPGDEAEKALRAELELISKSGEKSGGYTLFENTARRAANGGEIKNGTRQSLVTYMSNDMTRFRDLYVRLTGDAEYIRLAENEIYEDFETGIKDRERMTPYELGRAKAKIRDRVLRDKIAEGTATDRDYERVIEEAGRVTRELEAGTAALEKAVGELEEKLSDAARDYARQTRMLREKGAALADANEKVKKLAGALTKAERKAADAVLAKREALAEQKERMNAARAEEKAAAKLLADKRRIFDRAMKPPANNVDAKIAQNVRALQAAFSEAYSKGRAPANVTFNGQRMTLDEFRTKAARGDISVDGLPKRLKKYLDKAGINELTLKDAEAVMREVEYLKAEGRAVVKEKAAKRRALARYRIAQSLDAVNRAYSDPEARGAAKRLRAYLSAATPEEQAKILRRSDAFYRVKEGLQIDRLLELSKLDELKDLIAKGRDEANYQEGQHVNRRYKGLETLLGDTAKARNAKIAELGTENIPISGIWHNGRDWHFSKAFLMTASIGLDDPKMRTYLLYGSLMSSGERADLRDALDAARGDRDARDEYKARVKETGDEKEAILRQAIEDWLTEDDLKIRDFIRDDFTANFDRINGAAYEVDNALMTKVESYLPVFRKEKGADGEISVNGASFTYSKPENGFTVDRRNIPEHAVVPIETDIFKLFYRGVEAQEHFAAFAPFVKELNGVFGGRDARGRELKDKLRAMHGKGLINVIEDYIAVMANPKAADTGSDFGLGIVGKSTLGYITWNTLSGMKQVPQSFTPFLAKVKPEHIAASALKYIKSIGAFNNRDYNALTEAAYEKSSDLRRRVQNTEREYAQKIKDAAKSKPAKAYAFFVNDMGMRMQRAADEFACVAGWDAAYNEKYLELAKSGKLTDAESDKAAVKHADSVLAETQPTTNPLYQSMAFRKTPKVFKFFSTPLEKLFQMAAGIPGQVKRGEGAFVARYAAGAAITGLALAVLQRKLGAEDGEDPEKLARKLAYYGIAEPAMAHLPLAMLSSTALWFAERGILKEKRPAPQRDFLPLLSIGEDVVADIDGGKGDRLVKDAMEFAGYLLGLPTVQMKRIIKAAESGDVYGAFAGAR